MRRHIWLGVAMCACLLGCSDEPADGAPAGTGSAAIGAGSGAGSSATGGAGGSGGSGSAGMGTGGATGGTGSSALPDASDSSDASDMADASDGAAGTGSVSEGPFAVAALPFPFTPGTPIEAPNEQWSFVAFPESRCANGTPTGIAINPIANARGLLVFMQGGGACWDAEMCLVAKSSVHLEDTVNETVVLAEAAMLSGLFEHDNVANPFADYAYAYVPYCTGDLHAGTQENIYEGASGPVPIQHRGGLNLELYLERLIPTFPSIERVVVSGISAGGYGSTLNWWRYQAAFPNARVDVLDDAGLPVDAADDRWSIMVDAWGMVLPPGCDACGERMSAFLPFYGEHLVAPRRYALTGYLSDAVIGSYFDLTGQQISAQLLDVRANAAPNQKTFFLAGPQHSVIGEGAFTMASDGSTLLPWIIELASDAASWDHAGP